MAAVPKRKHSKARKNKRRSHLKLAVPALTKCVNCDMAVLAHTVCKNCGVYKGIQVLKAD